MSSVVGRERRLTIASAFDQQASVSITVEDTGSGIDLVQLERIFDPFFTTKPKQYVLRVKSLLSYGHKLGYMAFNAGVTIKIKPDRSRDQLASRKLMSSCSSGLRAHAVTG